VLISKTMHNFWRSYPSLVPMGLLVLGGCVGHLRDLTPHVFEPGTISTPLVEYGIAFSSDGSELYVARSSDPWGTPRLKSAIYHSVRKNGKWAAPKLASFSGTYNDGDPHLCPNGKTLYFTSDRPDVAAGNTSMDIWKVEREPGGLWGSPTRLDQTINSEADEYSPRTDVDGNLYFASAREGGYGQGDLYWAKRHPDGFGKPFNLGKTINSPTGEWNLEIDREGNILIFESSGRERNLSSYGDLYISFKFNEEWSIPQALTELNTTGSDLNPELAANDTMLYYASTDSLKGRISHIYAIDFEELCKRYKKIAVLPPDPGTE